MKLKTMTIALVAATAVGPSVGVARAQQTPPANNYYRTNSTPAEMSATQALNAKQAEMRGVSAGGESGAAIDASDQKVRADYEEKLRANEEQQKLYQQQMEEYKRKYGDPDAKNNAPARS